MILGDDAVSAIYRYLNAQKEDIGIGKGDRIFKYNLPERFAGGIYIVINFLPFVHRNLIGEGVININIHVPQTKNKEPDSNKLSAILKKVVEKFKDEIYLDGAYFKFDTDSTPVRDNDNTYYVNVKLNVIFSN